MLEATGYLGGVPGCRVRPWGPCPSSGYTEVDVPTISVPGTRSRSRVFDPGAGQNRREDTPRPWDSEPLQQDPSEGDRDGVRSVASFLGPSVPEVCGWTDGLRPDRPTGHREGRVRVFSRDHPTGEGEPGLVSGTGDIGPRLRRLGVRDKTGHTSWGGVGGIQCYTVLANDVLSLPADGSPPDCWYRASRLPVPVRVPGRS